jgi:hypothetical protein
MYLYAPNAHDNLRRLSNAKPPAGSSGSSTLRHPTPWPYLFVTVALGPRMGRRA